MGKRWLPWAFHSATGEDMLASLSHLCPCPTEETTQGVGSLVQGYTARMRQNQTADQGTWVLIHLPLRGAVFEPVSSEPPA